MENSTSTGEASDNRDVIGVDEGSINFMEGILISADDDAGIVLP